MMMTLSALGNTGTTHNQRNCARRPDPQYVAWYGVSLVKVTNYFLQDKGKHPSKRRNMKLRRRKLRMKGVVGRRNIRRNMVGKPRRGELRRRKPKEGEAREEVWEEEGRPRRRRKPMRRKLRRKMEVCGGK